VERCALVTGAAGDLGRATCVALAEDGWSLLIADHPAQAPRLRATGEACARLGTEAVLASFDVTDHAAVRRTTETLAEQHGVPTAVVAGAGVQGDFAPVQDYDIEVARRVLDVNVMGVFSVLAVTAALMARAETGGSIIAIASMAGVNGAPNMPAYSASKAAVIGLVKAASQDLSPHGIRVNAVSPGFIGPGAMWDIQVARQAAAGSQYYASEPEVVERQMIETIPMRRYGSPAEVANVIRFLAGDRSSYVTGVNIEIAGGVV
jgi:NAD(P)-dependent dehydrogenase (short-subunit alcohol dehydrogenase family)